MNVKSLATAIEFGLDFMLQSYETPSESSTIILQSLEFTFLRLDWIQT